MQSLKVLLKLINNSSNPCIIQTKEIMTIMMSRYLILIILDFYYFISPLSRLVSFIFDWEDIKHSRPCLTTLQKPQSSWKVLCYASYCQLLVSSRCLEMRQTWSFGLDILHRSIKGQTKWDLSLACTGNNKLSTMPCWVTNCISKKVIPSFYSLVVLVAEQWEKVVMFSIVEVTIFDVRPFPWLKDTLIHHFQGNPWPVT